MEKCVQYFGTEASCKTKNVKGGYFSGIFGNWAVRM
jgi:hypothetical protein